MAASTVAESLQAIAITWFDLVLHTLYFSEIATKLSGHTGAAISS
jgi:hypothetical protein